MIQPLIQALSARDLSPREKTLFYCMLFDVLWTTGAVVSAVLANSIILWTNTARVGLESFLGVLAFVGAMQLRRGVKNGTFDYGLGKLENVFSLFGGIIVLITLIIVGWQSLERSMNPEPLVGTNFGIFVLIAALSYNLRILYRLKQHLREENSPIIHTQSMIYRNASIASAVALVSVLIPTLFPDQTALYLLDPLGALILCIFLLQTGLTLVRESLFHLLDGSLEESMQMDITRALVDHFDAYEQLHALRSRRAGTQIFVELFLEFKADAPHQEMLANASAIKADLEQRLPSAVVWVIPVNAQGTQILA